jgi:anti-sigma B factor antagonist
VRLSSVELGDVVVAAPSGSINHPNAQELQQALAPILTRAAESGTAVVLDFSGIDYISSMGLRVLMMAAKQMRADDGRIVVAALQPIVQEIFDIARFRHVLEVFPTVRDALQAISAASLGTYDRLHP